MKDKSSRPEVVDRNAKIEGHDAIFLCFPIWWYINTFLESYDFSSKTKILFATSGGQVSGKS